MTIFKVLELITTHMFNMSLSDVDISNNKNKRRINYEFKRIYQRQKT